MLTALNWLNEHLLCAGNGCRCWGYKSEPKQPTNKPHGDTYISWRQTRKPCILHIGCWLLSAKEKNK